MAKRMSKEDALALVKRYKEDQKFHSEGRCSCKTEAIHLLILKDCTEKIHQVIRDHLQ